MPSVRDEKARSELRKEVLDLLATQQTQQPVSLDTAPPGSSRTPSKTLPSSTSPVTTRTNSAGASKSNGNTNKALANNSQTASSPDTTQSGKEQHGDQHGAHTALTLLPDPSSTQQHQHAATAAEAAADNIAASGTGSITKAWLADVAHRPREAGGSRAVLEHIKAAARSVGKVVRAHPYVLIVSLLTTAAIMTAGVVGVLAAADTETRHRKDSATGFANNAAVAFEVQLQQSFTPLVAMAAMIHVQPYYPALAKQFDVIAAELIAQVPLPGAIASLQMSPQGVVRSFYPLKGNEIAMGHNLLKDPERRGAALATIINGNLTMQGPVMLKQGFRGAVARTPVFIANVSEDNYFGATDRAHECDVCYNKTTRTRFWGFVSCIVKLADLASGKDARLTQLIDMGYDYEFFAPQPDKEPIVIAASASSLVDPVTAVVEVPNNEWTLLVAPSQGWVPSWRSPMLATVIVISLLIGGLVMATLVSRHLQLWLLKETKAYNVALADEKTRMDVLLARQYNLISCMAEQGGMTARSKKGTSLEQKTLDRIESMRREIGVASVSEGVDQVQLLELLGEGTYGKVYKGLWRGSTVAVKTMVLPAKMSGAEKRERMAIMEAAISSTMNHPNIVQTYTYTIKRATTSGVVQDDLFGDAISPEASGTGDSTTHNSQAFGSDASNSVHSFEVNLVLEYCDGGCLRDALDAGAFFSSGSLNYAAILDTAADVAKAMMHLHCNQVIHSDLKVRNVLLKSDGSSERGCVAKVADFGLALTLDHQDTHVSAFQGTMSHMAPEALLRGHISKAADVYSFGITLWELFTGCHAYHGIPRALLGHQVAVVGLRPSFPDFTPFEYRNLAEQCWLQEPDRRPSFAEILTTLTRMRTKLGGHTPALGRYQPQPSVLAERERALIEAAMSAGTSGGGGGGAAANLLGMPVNRSGGGGTTSTQEQQKQVAAAQGAGLLHFGSFNASYYVDSSSAGGHPLQKAWAAAAKTGSSTQAAHRPKDSSSQPEFHHFSEAGAELDALQHLYEVQADGDGSTAHDAGSMPLVLGATQQQKPARGASPIGQTLAQHLSAEEEHALTPEQQAAQQQVHLQLQILEQFAAQQQQQQQWQQQAQLHHPQPHGSFSSGSYSFDRRNRPKLATITDQPDAEAAVEQQQHNSTANGTA